MIGNVVDNYEIRALIGYGGMGTVYLAEHCTLGRAAAIKVLRRAFVGDPALVAGFINEARAANALEHPHIIAVMKVGQMGDGLPYIMMEHLPGQTLGQRLRREGRLSVRQMLPIVEQVAAALGAAHARGVVHGDLKPENLFLALAGGGAERVKVLDFGMARLRGARTRHRPDGQQTVLGTPAYLSPEQYRDGEADARSDVYALGALMYRMLCGTVPQPPQPPRALNPDLSPEVEAVILRALAKDPADRFATMAELAAALRQAARGTALAPVLRLVPPPKATSVQRS